MRIPGPEPRVDETVPPEKAAALKDMPPPENVALRKVTLPSEKVAPRKLHTLPENFAKSKVTVPPENTAAVKSPPSKVAPVKSRSYPHQVVGGTGWRRWSRMVLMMVRWTSRSPVLNPAALGAGS
ncbi:hypothetical protein [Streptomyces atriruber]|uniref:hypothetical protein n=1 Tax=Streptomyces atriruber TaxID=545121 RepID=UPI0012FF0397|nr:hypothetical protein [Streptomyces atriruber]